jgi:hypothetical protein
MTRELQTLLRVVPARADEGPYACPDCGLALELTQPLTDRPEELLAACSDCQEWHVLVVVDDDQATLTRLPIRGVVSASSEAAQRPAAVSSTLPMSRSRPAAGI